MPIQSFKPVNDLAQEILKGVSPNDVVPSTPTGQPANVSALLPPAPVIEGATAIPGTSVVVEEPPLATEPPKPTKQLTVDDLPPEVRIDTRAETFKKMIEVGEEEKPFEFAPARWVGAGIEKLMAPLMWLNENLDRPWAATLKYVYGLARGLVTGSEDEFVYRVKRGLEEARAQKGEALTFLEEIGVFKKEYEKDAADSPIASTFLELSNPLWLIPINPIFSGVKLGSTAVLRSLGLLTRANQVTGNVVKVLKNLPVIKPFLNESAKSLVRNTSVRSAHVLDYWRATYHAQGKTAAELFDDILAGTVRTNVVTDPRALPVIERLLPASGATGNRELRLALEAARDMVRASDNAFPMAVDTVAGAVTRIMANELGVKSMRRTFFGDAMRFWKSLVLWTPYYVIQNAVEDMLRTVVAVGKFPYYRNWKQVLKSLQRKLGDIGLDPTIADTLVGFKYRLAGKSSAIKLKAELTNRLTELKSARALASQAGDTARIEVIDRVMGQVQRELDDLPNIALALSKPAPPLGMEAIVDESDVFANFFVKANRKIKKFTKLGLPDSLVVNVANFPRAVANYFDTTAVFSIYAETLEKTLPLLREQNNVGRLVQAAVNQFRSTEAFARATEEQRRQISTLLTLSPDEKTFVQNASELLGNIYHDVFKTRNPIPFEVRGELEDSVKMSLLRSGNAAERIAEIEDACERATRQVLARTEDARRQYMNDINAQLEVLKKRLTDEEAKWIDQLTLTNVDTLLSQAELDALPSYVKELHLDYINRVEDRARLARFAVARSLVGRDALERVKLASGATVLSRETRTSISEAQRLMGAFHEANAKEAAVHNSIKAAAVALRDAIAAGNQETYSLLRNGTYREAFFNLPENVEEATTDMLWGTYYTWVNNFFKESLTSLAQTLGLGDFPTPQSVSSYLQSYRRGVEEIKNNALVEIIKETTKDELRFRRFSSEDVTNHRAFLPEYIKRQSSIIARAARAVGVEGQARGIRSIAEIEQAEQLVEEVARRFELTHVFFGRSPGAVRLPENSRALFVSSDLRPSAKLVINGNVETVDITEELRKAKDNFELYVSKKDFKISGVKKLTEEQATENWLDVPRGRRNNTIDVYVVVGKVELADFVKKGVRPRNADELSRLLFEESGISEEVKKLIDKGEDYLALSPTLAKAERSRAFVEHRGSVIAEARARGLEVAPEATVTIKLRIPRDKAFVKQGNTFVPLDEVVDLLKMDVDEVARQAKTEESVFVDVMREMYRTAVSKDEKGDIPIISRMCKALGIDPKGKDYPKSVDFVKLWSGADDFWRKEILKEVKADIKLATLPPEKIPEDVVKAIHDLFVPKKQSRETAELVKRLRSLDRNHVYIKERLLPKSIVGHFGDAEVVKEAVTSGLNRRVEHLHQLISEAVNVFRATQNARIEDLRNIERATVVARNTAFSTMGNYAVNTDLDEVMKRIFPFWYFPSRSIPFYLKTGLQYPILPRIFIRPHLVQKTSELPESLIGYIEIPINGRPSGIYISPFKPLMGYQLFGPEPLSGLGQPAVEQIYTAFGMLGFGVHPMISIGTELASKLAKSTVGFELTRGEPRPLFPQLNWVRSAIAATSGTYVPDLYSEVLVGRMPDWMRRNIEKEMAYRGYGVDSPETPDKAEARREAIKTVGLKSLISVVFPLYKHRYPEEIEMIKLKTNVLRQMGVTDEMLKYAKEEGFSPFLYLNEQDRRKIYEAHPEWDIWLGLTPPLMSPEEREYWEQTRAFYRQWTALQAQLQEEQKADTAEYLNGVMPASSWRRRFQERAGERANAWDLLYSHYDKALIDDERREAYRKQFGKFVPPEHPEDAVVRQYYNIRPLPDPLTNDLDFDTMMLRQESYLDAIKKSNPEVYNYLLREIVTPRLDGDTVEEEYRLAKRIMRPYFMVRPQMYASKPTVKELVWKAKKLRETNPAAASELLKDPAYKEFTRKGEEARRQLRLSDPLLEYLLLKYGYITNIINPATERYLQRPPTLQELQNAIGIKK